MAGVAGVFNRDGEPATAVAVQRIVRAAAERGPDGAGCWVDGPVGLGHLALVTTPEAALEVQPVHSEASGLAVTLDGRIDNRQDIRDELGLDGPATSDARLLLAAYSAWGPDCAARLIGDFAFALWDSRQRQLVCARDCFGVAPFYYFASPALFTFGSELRQLLAHDDVPCRPSEGVVAEFLTNDVRSVDETLYQGILRLPPAHVLIVTRSDLRTWRYWTPDPRKETRYRHSADYAEHFSSLLQEAVRCRTRCRGKVGAFLSGGLDSSSVVGMTARLLRDGAVPDLGFETFSLVFPGLPCDESSYIDDVTTFWKLRSNRFCPEIDGGACYQTDYGEMARRFCDLPNYPNGCTADPVKQDAARRGFRVLLTGLGGDDWLTGSLMHWADSIRHGRLLALARQLWFDRRVPWVDFSAKRVLADGLGPVLDRRLLALIRTLKRRPNAAAASVLAPSFARAARLGERHRAEDPDWPSFAQADLWAYSTSGYQVHVLEMEDRHTASQGVEQRHPLSDRRLVEFALSIPEEERWRRDLPKYVLREAMRELLPESVRLRRTKASFSHPTPRVLSSRTARDTFARLAVAEEGWVDQHRVDEVYGGFLREVERGQSPSQSLAFALWAIYAVELWLRVLRSSDVVRARARRAG